LLTSNASINVVALSNSNQEFFSQTSILAGSLREKKLQNLILIPVLQKMLFLGNNVRGSVVQDLRYPVHVQLLGSDEFKTVRNGVQDL
jgi:hypothetical protein